MRGVGCWWCQCGPVANPKTETSRSGRSSACIQIDLLESIGAEGVGTRHPNSIAPAPAFHSKPITSPNQSLTHNDWEARPGASSPSALINSPQRGAGRHRVRACATVVGSVRRCSRQNQQRPFADFSVLGRPTTKQQRGGPRLTVCTEGLRNKARKVVVKAAGLLAWMAGFEGVRMHPRPLRSRLGESY